MRGNAEVELDDGYLCSTVREKKTTALIKFDDAMAYFDSIRKKE